MLDSTSEVEFSCGHLLHAWKHWQKNPHFGIIKHYTQGYITLFYGAGLNAEAPNGKEANRLRMTMAKNVITHWTE